MGRLTVYVENASRMISWAKADKQGIRLTFADGRRGLIPFSAIPEILSFENLVALQLPNPYVLVARLHTGEVVELPWDFARHYCDPTYRAKSETVGNAGRKALGNRVRQLREQAGITQEALATAAEIGRVTLLRIENGKQSPRYDTVLAIAHGLGCSIDQLLMGIQTGERESAT